MSPLLIMVYLILFLLIGVNLVPFVLPQIDMWNAQQLWCWTLVSLIFCWSLSCRPKKISLPNIPLSLLFSWVTIFTMLLCVFSISKGRYNIKQFLPYFNFICVLILYRAVQEYLDEKKIVQILNIMRYTIICTLFMCTLQFLGLSQFFELLKDVPFEYSRMHNNIVTGFLGNGTHLSGFLGCSVPLFLWHGKREDWLALILIFIILCFCGTTIGDPSISGFVIGGALILYFFKDHKVLFYSGIVVCLLAIIAVMCVDSSLLCSNGRVEVWKIYWRLFKQMPVTGQGLGSIMLVSKYTAIPSAKHLHMEFFHFTFELGIIGGVLIINLIKNFISIKPCSKTELCLKTMVIGFLLSSCFNYPAHLWLPSTWVIFSYAALLNLKNKEKISWEE